MNDLQLPTADAYLSWGKWVADCPRCTDARAVYPEGAPSPDRVLDQVCAGGHRFRIVMPPPRDEARIVDAVAGRPPAERFWWPAGHPMAPPRKEEKADA